MLLHPSQCILLLIIINTLSNDNGLTKEQCKNIVSPVKQETNKSDDNLSSMINLNINEPKLQNKQQGASGSSTPLPNLHTRVKYSDLTSNYTHLLGEKMI